MKTATGSLARSAAVLFAIALLFLAGCAAPARVARPADFAFHSTDQFFTLHWTEEREGGVVRAVGLVETRGTTFSDLTLELFGLDRAGRIVSRGFGVVRPGFGREPQPFTVELRLAGQEERFELIVSSVTLNGLRGGRG